MSTPHDALFAYTFGDAEHAGPLLRSLLPPALVAAIDWSTLQPAPVQMVDERQQESRGDRLFTVRIRGRLCYLRVLLEHKSRPDRWAPLQMLAYEVGLWQQLRRERPRPRRLPPIVPVVVHFGRRRWHARTDLHALLDVDGLDPSVRDALLACQPQFAFVPHDFATRSAAEVRGMALTLQGLWTVCGLQFLAPVGDDDDAVVAAIAEWADVMRRILVAPTGQQAWDALTSYILKVTKLDHRRLRIVLDEQIGTPAMKKFVSTWDQTVVAGEAKGKALGRAEGRAEMLLRQLQKRFGAVPAATRKRVLAAAIADLDHWAERVLDAASLAEVFARG